MTNTPTIIWVEHRTDLPDWLALGVGRIAIEFSDLEWQLEETIRVLLTTGIKFGRIMTTGMSFRSRLATARSLVQAYVFDGVMTSLHLDQFSLMHTQAENCEKGRNILMHGIWGFTKNQWIVLRSNSTRDGPQLDPEIKKMTRAVLPQSEVIDEKYLADLLAQIRSVRVGLKNFRASATAVLPPSSHKPPDQYQDGEALPYPKGNL